jgi:hypothetical protein
MRCDLWSERKGILVAAAATEPAMPSRAFIEVRYGRKCPQNHRDKYKLGQALQRLEFERYRSPIPATHHQRSLVVRVDEPDQIPKHYAVLVAQSRTRQDQRRQARVANVNGDTRRDQLSLAGHQRDRRIDAGAQVHAGGTRRRVGREKRANSLVEDFERDRRPGRVIGNHLMDQSRIA